MAYSRWTLTLLLAVAAGGCSASETDLAGSSVGGPMNDTMPPWSMCDTDTGTGTDTDGCGSSSGAGSTGAPDSACSSSAECSSGSVCAATFDAGNQELGTFECRFTCIAELDDSQWCRDDASCCDAGAVCTQRGYCVIGDESTTGAGGSTSGGDTDGTTGGQ